MQFCNQRDYLYICRECAVSAVNVSFYLNSPFVINKVACADATASWMDVRDKLWLLRLPPAASPNWYDCLRRTEARNTTRHSAENVQFIFLLYMKNVSVRAQSARQTIVSGFPLISAPELFVGASMEVVRYYLEQWIFACLTYTGVGFTEIPPANSSVSDMFDLANINLSHSSHIHIWQMSTQLICGDIP